MIPKACCRGVSGARLRGEVRGMIWAVGQVLGPGRTGGWGCSFGEGVHWREGELVGIFPVCVDHWPGLSEVEALLG